MDKENERNMRILKARAYNVSFNLNDTDYKRIENIGIGAYGVVCSAIHKTTLQKVAIKKIPNIFDVHTTAMRTYREIMILKHFKHDNIIAIRDIIQPREDVAIFRDVYIVMDLMESDLHRIIHSHQEISDEHIRYFLYQIIRALKYIHSANVIHRDLKPSNLLVNEDCLLKIGDFGMARGVSSSREQSDPFMTQYVATRWYRAPEIMMSHLNYTVAVDMWSVGCILAEMLGRKVLFPGKDFLNQLKLICSVLGTPSASYLSHIQSDMIRTIVQRLGVKESTPWNKLYPVANRKAIDLLSRLVTLNPQERMSAEEALRHPYLSKYHDPHDEPRCIPAFTFDFENVGLRGEQLREAIISAIKDYEKPYKKSSFKLSASSSAHLSAFTTCSSSIMDDVSKRAGNSVDDGRLANANQLNQIVGPQQHDQHSLNVDTATVGNVKDVDMPTADANKAEPTVKEETRDKGKPEYKTISNDTKALIKATLLQSQKQRTEINSKDAGDASNKPVTALQRQREREERRLKKKERAREKVKRTRDESVESENANLTQADKDLLARWEIMQSGTKATQSNVNASNTNTDITTSCNTNVSIGNASNTNANNEHANENSVVGFSGTAADPSTVNIRNDDRGASVNPERGQQNLHHPNWFHDVVVGSNMAGGVGDINMETLRATRDIDKNASLFDSSQYGVLLDQTGLTRDATFQRLPTFENNAASVENCDGNVDDLLDANLVSLLSDQLCRSQVDDILPPQLTHTPRGTGGGYGVGLDLGSLIGDGAQDHSDEAGERLGSTPVSASLLADWMDVTANMSASELEALINDSEMASPINFSDLTLPVEPSPDYD